MKLKAARLYIPFFTLLVLLQLYVTSFRANILIQLAVLCLLVFLDKTVISKKFTAYLLPFTAMFFLAFVGTLLHRHSVYQVIKDVFHLIKPVIGLLLGYILFSRINNFTLFVKGVIIAGVISAVFHFYILAFKVNLSIGSIAAIREYTKDNFLELFSIFFLIYYKKLMGRPVWHNKLMIQCIMAFLLLSGMLYFSRTMIVMAAVLFLTLYGYTRITKNTVIVLGLFTVLTGLLYVYLYSADIRRSSKGFQGFLYKIKIAPEEIYKTHINREDHRDLWDHWRGYEAARAIALMKQNPSSFIFGNGMGSQVNLKFYAPIMPGKGLRYISELHNGYIYILYKLGVIGLLIYLFVLLRWYAYIYKRRTFCTLMISAIGAIYLFSTITITGTYNARDVIIFILGGLLWFAEREAMNKKNHINISQENA